MRFSEFTGAVFAALALAQAESRAPTKNKQGYNYTYADLDETMDCIKEPIAKAGLMLFQGNGMLGATYGLFTRVVHIKSGQWIESFIPMDTQVDPQDQGKENTYFRRYSINNLFNLIAEDDTDANFAKDSKKTSSGKRPGVAPKITSVKNFGDSNGF